MENENVLLRAVRPVQEFDRGKSLLPPEKRKAMKEKIYIVLLELAGNPADMDQAIIDLGGSLYKHFGLNGENYAVKLVRYTAKPQ